MVCKGSQLPIENEHLGFRTPPQWWGSASAQGKMRRRLIRQQAVDRVSLGKETVSRGKRQWPPCLVTMYREQEEIC